MKLTKSDIEEFKELIARAKKKYYTVGDFLRIRLQNYSPRVGCTLVNGQLVRNKVVLPERMTRESGTFEVDDEAYDFMEKVVKSVDPDWEPASGVDLDRSTVAKKFKEALPVPMSSLGKAYPDDGKLAKFSKAFPGPYVVSDKLDGNALEIVYKANKKPTVYTKTSSTVGQNVTYLLPHLNVPQQLPIDLVVRFETIISKQTFESKYKIGSATEKPYKNARNMVAGIFNKKGVHKAIGDVELLAHQIMNSKLKPSAQLKKLESLGFSVVPHRILGRVTDSVLLSMLRKRKASASHNIDGLVVTQDKPHANSSTAEDPVFAIAFKENDSSNLAETKVISVEWNASKHGSLRPRVNIKPVELAGATINWVSGRNAFFIEHGYNYGDKQPGSRKPVGPGAIVKVTRSGEVVPYIVEVVKPAKVPAMPKVKYKYNDNKTQIYLQSGVKDSVVQAKRITAFLREGLGVEGMALGVVTKCYSTGMTRITDFLNATPDDFLEVDGVQTTSANKYYAQIQKGLHNANQAAVAANSGFFGENFGSRRMESILEKISFTKLSMLDESEIAAKVGSFNNFDTILAKRFAKGFHKYMQWVSKLPIKFAKTVEDKVSTKLKGQAICFTGFRDAALEKKIKSNGGTIASGVSSKTTILLVKDKSSSSSKIVKASSLGISIYTAAEFLKKYGGL